MHRGCGGSIVARCLYTIYLSLFSNGPSRAAISTFKFVSVTDGYQINKPHLAYTILGGFTSVFMLCSLFIKEKLYIGEASKLNPWRENYQY